MRTRLLALAAIAVWGCGSDADDIPNAPPANGDAPPGQSPPPTAPPASTPPSDAILLPAKRGTEVFVTRVDPSSGTVTAFGPALPGITPTPLVDAWLEYDATASRAVVLVRREGGDTLFAGDGTSWRVLASGFGGGYGQYAVSDDVSLVWTSRSAVDGSTARPAAFRFDGTPLLDMGAAQPFESSPQFIGFAADGSYVGFVRPGGNLVVRRANGQESTVAQNAATSSRFLSFATSVVLDGEWRDLAGKRIEVAGFEADGLLRSGYQVSGGKLARLSDRRVDVLGSIPPERSPSDLRAVARNGQVSLFRANTDLVAYAADGAERARFTPQVPTTPAGIRTVELSIPQAFLGGTTMCALVHTVVSLIRENSDVGETLVDRTELWSPPNVRALRKPEVAAGWNLTSDCRFVVWVEEHKVHRFSMETGQEDVLASGDFVFDRADLGRKHGDDAVARE